MHPTREPPRGPAFHGLLSPWASGKNPPELGTMVEEARPTQSTAGGEETGPEENLAA